MSKGRPVSNKHKVPKRKWNKWSRAARKTFNDMMYSMRPKMQWAYLHPAAKLMTREHWQTTRWNASWIAADLVDGLGVLKGISNV